MTCKCGATAIVSTDKGYKCWICYIGHDLARLKLGDLYYKLLEMRK